MPPLDLGAAEDEIALHGERTPLSAAATAAALHKDKGGHDRRRDHRGSIGAILRAGGGGGGGTEVHAHGELRTPGYHGFMLFITMLPVVLLAKSMAKIIKYAVTALLCRWYQLLYQLACTRLQVWDRSLTRAARTRRIFRCHPCPRPGSPYCRQGRAGQSVAGRSPLPLCPQGGKSAADRHRVCLSGWLAGCLTDWLAEPLDDGTAHGEYCAGISNLHHWNDHPGGLVHRLCDQETDRARAGDAPDLCASMTSASPPASLAYLVAQRESVGGVDYRSCA